MDKENRGSISIKEDGNAAFTSGKYKEALDLYALALSRTPADASKERLAILKNQAACHLKLQNYNECVVAATSALEISSNDPKALFRRCQALENLNRTDEAYKDARLLAHMQPGDSSTQEILQRLSMKLQDITKNQASTERKVAEMLQYLSSQDKSVEVDKRRTAANNLFSVAKDKTGANYLMEKKAPEMFVKLLKDSSTDASIQLAVVRALGELFRGDVPRCRDLLRKRIGLPPILNVYTMNHEELVIAASVAIENALRTLSDWLDKERPDKAMIKENQDDIDHIMETLLEMADRAVLSAVGRDALIDVILKNVTENVTPGLGWCAQFMNHEGIGRFLQMAVLQPKENRNESTPLVTNETRIHIALALQKMYDDLDSDSKRKTFQGKCEAFVQGLLIDPEPSSKIKAILAIITLLQGPFDVGNFLLGTKGILDMLFTMANSEDPNQQLVAAEAIVHAASKKDKSAAILADGYALLQRLAKSPNDNVQVRALVGLCKVGSSGGIDASNRPLPTETMQSLAESCRKYLVNPTKDFDLRRWAAEGLAYITMDADVKESLVADRAALKSLVELGKTGDQNVIYGVVSVLANLVNAYEKPEVVPEMKELAQFAKQHVPVEHAKDAVDYVAKRVTALVEEGVGSALVAMSKSESKNIHELISRIFNVIVETRDSGKTADGTLVPNQKDVRGLMVQQGATKVLIKLALNGTDKGKEQASQALARIGITIDPARAFPGERAYEVVRPLLNLLEVEKTALQNFEALLALTNLAQMGESVRQRIMKDGGISKIEHYMYEEHDMLKRAAVQCVCNLMQSEKMQELYINSETDRVKLLVLYSADEDRAVALAASAALAMVTHDPKACKKVMEPKAWLDALKEISVAELPALRERALLIVGNLIANSQEAAEAITQCEILEILMATSMLTGPENKKFKDLALRALRAAYKKKLIAPNPTFEEIDEDS